MKLSIITVNWNNASGLEKTIESVAGQSTGDFEYIIVDGDSSDGSVEVIKKYEDRFSSLVWVSEKDSGIYNAMNKASRMAHGDYLLFLNGGDCFANTEVVSRFNNIDSDANFIIGRVNVTKSGKIIGRSKLLNESDLGLFNMCLEGICHQAAFISRELMLADPYDESYKISADWKFFIRQIVLAGKKVLLIPDTIADYDGTGISSTNMAELNKERQRCMDELLPARIRSDYEASLPHYNEFRRVGWLLEHRFWYIIYRKFVSLGITLLK